MCWLAQRPARCREAAEVCVGPESAEGIVQYEAELTLLGRGGGAERGVTQEEQGRVRCDPKVDE